MKRALLVIFLVLAADQALKVWVKLNMYYDGSISLFSDWGYLHFIENPGMAFGLQFGGTVGKLVLSLFRIIVMLGLIWYLRRSIQQKAHGSLIISLSLILAGAIGNIIDSAFYGLVFSASTPFELARFLPEEGGYASFLHGHVVDMFYFPLFEGDLPTWLPYWGGQHFLFFRPVFNIADASVTIGAIALILFHRKALGHAVAAQVDEVRHDIPDQDGSGNDPAEPMARI